MGMHMIFTRQPHCGLVFSCVQAYDQSAAQQGAQLGAVPPQAGNRRALDSPSYLDLAPPGHLEDTRARRDSKPEYPGEESRSSKPTAPEDVMVYVSIQDNNPSILVENNICWSRGL